MLQAYSKQLATFFEGVKRRRSSLSLFVVITLCVVSTLILPTLIYVKMQSTIIRFDKRLETLDQKISSFERAGYVEGQSLADITNLIYPSVVIIFDKNGKVGTGFFVSQNGDIVTAKHVVQGSNVKDLTVRDISGIDHKIVKQTEMTTDSDIALIKINGRGYRPVTIGYWENIKVGEDVGMIGFTPTAQKTLLYKGIVSDKGQDSNGAPTFKINNFINGGNSGGPIFSIKTGKVIGLVSSRDIQPLDIKPLDLTSSVYLGGYDPLKVISDIHNENLFIAKQMSQIGVGNAYALDGIARLQFQ